ncbi:MAG TPA: CYTH domain-containing protein, partial [Candidatus Limnocylindrales bacterium]
MARTRPVEIELKYRVIDAAAGDAYLGADDLAGFHPASPVRSAQVEDRYIDTADGAMARAGFAARLRQTAKGTTVAVKSAVRRVGSGNVHRREELEGPADRTAHPRDWPPSDARSLLLEQCGDAPLVELVTIRQLRRKRILERDGTAVELSLDEVDAVTRSRVVSRFVELEVELVRGDEAGLADIDRLLAADPGLAPAETSKLQSALRAVADAEPKRGRRRTVVLPPVDGDDEAIDDDGSARRPSDDPGQIAARILIAAETPQPTDAETTPNPPAATEPTAPAGKVRPAATAPAEPRRRKPPGRRR